MGDISLSPDEEKNNKEIKEKEWRDQKGKGKKISAYKWRRAFLNPSLPAECLTTRSGGTAPS